MTASAAVDPPFSRIGIVGVGLIGGSIAMAAHAAWPAVHVVGVDGPDELAQALDAGAIDAAEAWIDALRDADLVVIATPMFETIAFVRGMAEVKLPGLVVDVGSTKRDVMQAAEDAGLVRFIGTHPMAGAERGGLAHARADLFKDRPWLVVRPAGASADDVARLERFVTGLGAEPRAIDAEAHDRAMAYVSHLPQILAVALMTAAGQHGGEAALDIAGPAFREMTRLAASPADLWRGILATNADFIEEAIDALALCLPRSAAALSAGDWTHETFGEAQRWRARLDAGPRQS